MLDLSLLVCAKNSSKSIIFCLKSSLPILKANAELILLDGRSEDNTIELVKDFLNQNDIVNFKIISQSKPGLYEAFNLAIENATRTKLFFLHSDDVLKCCNTLIEDVYHCNADVIFYGIEIKGKFFKRKWHIKSLSGININSMVIPSHVGILVHKNVYNKIGVFRTDYKIASDFDWMLRLLNFSNISFSFSSEIIYMMNSGGISNSGFLSEILKFLEDVRVLRSNGYNLTYYKVFLKKITKLWQYKKL
jgi:glycosyltransferase involved in cell wall biosynthesis